MTVRDFYLKGTLVDNLCVCNLWHISKCNSIVLVHNVDIYNITNYILSILTCDEKHNMPI